jgi:hypothetical protein
MTAVSYPFFLQTVGLVNIYLGRNLDAGVWFLGLLFGPALVGALPLLFLPLTVPKKVLVVLLYVPLTAIAVFLFTFSRCEPCL